MLPVMRAPALLVKYTVASGLDADAASGASAEARTATLRRARAGATLRCAASCCESMVAAIAEVEVGVRRTEEAKCGKGHCHRALAAGCACRGKQ